MRCFEIGNKLSECAGGSPAGPCVLSLNRKELKTASLPAEVNLAQCAVSSGFHFCKLDTHEKFLSGNIRVLDESESGGETDFFFALWAGGVLFADESGLVDECLSRIAAGKTWREPGVGCFFHDFLAEVLLDEQRRLSGLEDRLEELEEKVLDHDLRPVSREMLTLRKEILHCGHYYSQFADLIEDLREDEIGFFTENELRLFALLDGHVARLSEETAILREYSLQIQEVYENEVAIRQNDTMKLLTVVTTIFLPLTLLVGWYGMNFANMPELQWRWGYAGVIVISLALLAVELVFFRRKKLL